MIEIRPFDPGTDTDGVAQAIVDSSIWHVGLEPDRYRVLDAAEVAADYRHGRRDRPQEALIRGRGRIAVARELNRAGRLPPRVRYGRPVASGFRRSTLATRWKAELMPTRVEAYTATGIATGTVAAPGHVRGHVEGLRELLVEGSEWLPLDGSPGRMAGDMKLPVDDLLLLVSDELDDVPGHAQWHTIDLDAGPYRIEGELSTMPGFDPGRALARPSGQFVLLRDVRITLLSEPNGGDVRCPHALVNRYTVDRIAADIMLGFFFPGAAMSMTLGGATTRGAAIPSPATTPGTAPATPSAADAPAPAASPAMSAEDVSPTETAGP